MEEKLMQRITLIIVAVSSFITPFMSSSLNVALPAISQQFSLNAVMLSWVATSFLLAAAVFLVPFGKVADMYGRKKIFLLGIIIFTITTFLCGLATNKYWFLIYRILQGLGSSMIFGTGLAILSAVFPQGKRGKALGISVSMVYLGLTAGPFVGGLLTQHLGWRSIFFANVLLGLLVLCLMPKLKGEWAEGGKKRFDWLGSFLYAVSIVSLIYGFSKVPQAMGFYLLAFALILLLLFLYYETRIDHPVMQIGLFRDNAVFTFSNLAALINYSATFAVLFLLSMYLQFTRGLNPQIAGIVMLAQPLVMVIGSPIAGRLSDKVEPRLLSSLGMLISAIGLALLVLINLQTPLYLIVLNLMLLGLGFSLFSSPNTNAVMGSIEKKHFGVASALLGTMRLTGQMFSMGIAMMTIALFIGKSKIVPANFELFLHAMKLCYTIFALLCVLGTFFSLARGKVHTSK
jgi:EmrB/QacA subfamily drug resistance transporter